MLGLRGLCLTLLVGVLFPSSIRAADDTPRQTQGRRDHNPRSGGFDHQGSAVGGDRGGDVLPPRREKTSPRRAIRKGCELGARRGTGRTMPREVDVGTPTASSRHRVVMYGTNDSYVDAGQTAPRVTQDEFVHNLRRIVERVREAGAIPS